jgi:hypothetical protein
MKPIPLLRAARHLLCTLTLLATTLAAQAAQKEMWWTYEAQYDKTPGTTLVNLALEAQAPNAAYPYVVITGISYQTRRADRLPDREELTRIQPFDEQIMSTVAAAAPAIWAGTFTNDGQRLQYVYVKNTTGVEAALQKFYAAHCKACQPYIHIKEDRNWEAYSNFLYPNQATRDANQAELAQLEQANNAHYASVCTSRAAVDAMLDQIRTESKWDITRDMVWGYFFVADSTKPLTRLAERLKADGYRVVGDIARHDGSEMYWLHVEKIETHSADSLDKRDHELCALAAQFPDAKYDGMDVGPVGAKK